MDRTDMLNNLLRFSGPISPLDFDYAADDHEAAFRDFEQRIARFQEWGSNLDWESVQALMDVFINPIDFAVLDVFQRGVVEGCWDCVVQEIFGGWARSHPEDFWKLVDQYRNVKPVQQYFIGAITEYYPVEGWEYLQQLVDECGELDDEAFSWLADAFIEIKRPESILNLQKMQACSQGRPEEDIAKIDKWIQELS